MALWRGIPAFLTCNLPSTLKTQHKGSQLVLNQTVQLDQVSLGYLYLYDFIPFHAGTFLLKSLNTNSLMSTALLLKLSTDGRLSQQYGLRPCRCVVSEMGFWIHVHRQQNTQKSGVKHRAVLTDREGVGLDWIGCLLGLSKLHCYNLVYIEKFGT